MTARTLPKRFEPPAHLSRDEVVARSNAVLAMPDRPISETEDIFRIQALDLEWDLGVMIYQPVDPHTIARGADGKKVGIFVLHGGSGDYKSMADICRTFAKKHITPDQYVVHRDTSMRLRYGTRTVAHAKPGTFFWDRMAGWPVAFELGMKEAMRRHFPEDEFSIYVTGHSTGGPMVFMICQRVANIAGVIAVENSPFGFIQEEQHAWSGALGKIAGYERVTKQRAPRVDPFNELYIRTWRDRARYAGPEALGQEGPKALMRLPSLMEEIFVWWDKTKARPNFKAEYIITHNIQPSLEAAANAVADRLGLDTSQRKSLVAHYKGFPYPQIGEGAKPVPPVLYVITKDSRDHSPEVYQEVVLPMFARMTPQPKVRLTQFGAGVHTYHKPEEGLPYGIVPPVAEFYFNAITGGYFLV
jgi:hypothetical protein